MIVTTGNDVPGQNFRIIGVVRGNTVQMKDIIKDIGAGIRNIVGGESKSYSNLTSESRDMAYARMIENAERMQADGIVAMRFDSGHIVEGAMELLAYGTAVKFV
jgi:uncharacterized protein YbjQ (UPF0145 family)